MKTIIKIKGKASVVFDIIQRLDTLHGTMTLKEYEKRMGN
jgi:hypothetical protein